MSIEEGWIGLKREGLREHEVKSRRVVAPELVMLCH